MNAEEFNEAYQYDKSLEEVLITSNIELSTTICKKKFELIDKYQMLNTYENMIGFCEEYNVYLSGLIGNYITDGIYFK